MKPLTHQASGSRQSSGKALPRYRPRARLLAHVRCPQQHGEHRDGAPDGDRNLPVDPEGMLERRGQAGRDGCAPGKRHRVQRGHQHASLVESRA